MYLNTYYSILEIVLKISLIQNESEQYLHAEPISVL